MIKFAKGAGDNTLSFPVTQSAMDALLPCTLASPRAGDMHDIALPDALATDAAIGVACNEILNVRYMVTRGEFPWEFMRKYYPAEWGEFPQSIPQPLANERLSYSIPQGLANVVHMDNPMDLGMAIHSWLLGKGAKPSVQDDRYVNFLMNVPEVMRDMGADIADALDVAFDVKYYHGVARPEEYAGSNVTAYAEGCPTHPSFPSGHGAAAGATSEYFLNNWDLSEDDQKVVFDCAYIWSMARSFAGVHYAVDNLPFLPSKP